MIMTWFIHDLEITEGKKKHTPLSASVHRDQVYLNDFSRPKCCSKTSSYCQQHVCDDLIFCLLTVAWTAARLPPCCLDLQRVHGLLSAVQRVDVVWTRVVQHGVPVWEHLDSAGTDTEHSHRLSDQQGDHSRHAALQHGDDVLQQSAGTERHDPTVNTELNSFITNMWQTL